MSTCMPRPLPLQNPADLENGCAHVMLDGLRISYALRRSPRRRSISLSIDERGLRVAAPLSAPQSAIAAMLIEHRAWIVRKVGEWQARRPPPRQWEPGELIMFMGMPLQLAARDGIAAAMLDGQLLCYGPHTLDAAGIEKRVQDWLRLQALDCFTGICHRHASQLGVAAPAVRLSNARTRWGSCHADGRIRMHWRLIQAPREWIEYVAAHEVAHLRQMNHSPEFWRTVAELVPDHAQRRAALRREAHRYLLL